MHPHLPRPIWVGLVSAFAIFLYINLIVVPRLVAERVEVLMEERKVGESRAHSKNDAKSGSASSSCAHSSDKVSFAPEPDSSGKAITSMQAGKIDVLQEAKEQQKYFCDRIFPQFVQRGTASSMMRLERDLQFGGKGFGEESLDMYVISEGDVVSTFITVQRAWQQRQVDGWVEKMDEFAKRRGLDREQLTFIDVGYVRVVCAPVCVCLRACVGVCAHSLRGWAGPMHVAPGSVSMLAGCKVNMLS